MIVISRRKNESIHIGDEIVVTVVEIRGDRVRLGIEAPREVPWHRPPPFPPAAAVPDATDAAD